MWFQTQTCYEIIFHPRSEIALVLLAFLPRMRHHVLLMSLLLMLLRCTVDTHVMDIISDRLSIKPTKLTKMELSSQEPPIQGQELTAQHLQ